MTLLYFLLWLWNAIALVEDVLAAHLLAFVSGSLLHARPVSGGVGFAETFLHGQWLAEMCSLKMHLPEINGPLGPKADGLIFGC